MSERRQSPPSRGRQPRLLAVLAVTLSTCAGEPASEGPLATGDSAAAAAPDTPSPPRPDADDLPRVGPVPRSEVVVGPEPSCEASGTPGTFTDASAALTGAETPAAAYEGGLAVADFDGDGWLDLLVLTQPGTDHALYLTGGRGPLAYEHRRIDNTADVYASGAYPVDLDEDGDLDVVLTGSLTFLINGGDGELTRTQQLFPAAAPNFNEGAAGWSDFDGDGHVDVLLAGGKSNTFGVEEGSPERLFRGRGAMVFEAVPLPVPPREGEAFIAAFVDVDNDAWPDAYVVNDFGMSVLPNRLLLNDGQGGFLEAADQANADVAVWGMGLAVGDVDNDGWLDLFTPTMTPLHDVLLHNLGDGTFEDVTAGWAASSIAVEPGVSWGAVFVDVDSDGDEDLYVAHGYHPGLEPNPDGNAAVQHDVLFINEGGHLRSGAAEAGIDAPGSSRSPVEADLDGDGFPDLAVGVHAGRPYLFRNHCADDRAWVGVRFGRSPAHRSGAGARIEVRAGGRLHVREVGVGNDGLHGGGPEEVAIGLGAADRIDSLRIVWPGGAERTVADAPLRRWLTVWQPR